MPDPADRTLRGRWARLSLQVRVTAAAGTAIAAGLVVLGVLLVLSLRAGLVAGVDDAAQSRADTAAVAVRRGDLPLAVATSGGDGSLVQVLDEHGEVLAGSPGLERVAPLVPVPVVPGRQQQADVSIAERDFRALTTTAGRRVVVVVSPLSDVQESTTALVTRVLVGAPVLLGMVCAVIWLLVGYTLRTVDRLRGQVQELSGTGRERRVDVPAAHDEVRQLALTMNDLLDRLQRAAQAQRRFVADAAHELRGPLAALRTRLEVSERAQDPGRWQLAAPVLVSDVERLSRLVDDLLALARLDEFPHLRRAEPVDLDEVVLAEVRRLRDAAHVVLDARGVSAALVRGDADLLVRVVANLLANAVRHATTRVRVTLSTSDGRVELTVADDGPGIPVVERERVFERFHRLDAARDRDRGGSGLGLAIVRDAVRAHQGVVSIQDAGPGTLVVVWLPQDPQVR